MHPKTKNLLLLSSGTAYSKGFQLPMKGMKEILYIPCNKEKNI